jgi:hypothetical protein
MATGQILEKLRHPLARSLSSASQRPQIFWTLVAAVEDLHTASVKPEGILRRPSIRTGSMNQPNKKSSETKNEGDIRKQRDPKPIPASPDIEERTPYEKGLGDVEDYPGPTQDHPEKKGQNGTGRADENIVTPPARPD